MRHKVDHRKLGRTAAHRKAMLSNMVTSLFDKERIRTTDAKAKEARRHAERLITRAKKGYSAYQEHQSLKSAGKEAEARQMQAVALAHWRQAGRVVRKQSVLKKLFDVIAPQYLERNGGYTRILHLSRRPGDNAQTVLLELVGVSEERAEEAPKGKKGGKKAAAVAGKKPRKKTRKAKKEEPEAAEAKAEEAKTEGPEDTPEEKPTEAAASEEEAPSEEKAAEKEDRPE
jgi:large subunit ribosomal protein L17